MNVRKTLRVLHRDFGYFIVAAMIIYAFSGILLNHRGDFNSNYKRINYTFNFNTDNGNLNSKDDIINVFVKNDVNVKYKKHFFTKNGEIKVFVENGEVILNIEKKSGEIDLLIKKPVFYQINQLHRGATLLIWKWVSDILATIMIFVAISGLFILKGKNSITKRGWIFLVLGLIPPLIFIILYI